MKHLLIVPFIIVHLFSYGQYTTPGTGVVWNMDSLLSHSGGIVNPGGILFDYMIEGDLTISENDSIYIDNNNVAISNPVTITVEGDLSITNSNVIPGDILPGQEFGFYQGMWFAESADVYFYESDFWGCGGIKVITPNFIAEDCAFMLPASIGITSGGLIEISNGKPIITGCDFSNSINSAISSAANSMVAPIITDNIFSDCVMSNTNRPCINLGPSGTDTTLIENNQITGLPANEMAGGLAFSSLVGGEGHVVIRGNTVNSHRYGIAIIGNGLNALIDNNQLLGNSIQQDPFLGGSGVNLNGNQTSFAVLSNNTFIENHWGVTIQGNFLVNLGGIFDVTPSSVGGNYFNDNGNGGQTFALFNNTPNDVSALYNCWSDSSEVITLEIAESVISHQVDDSSLGQVYFDPLGDCGVVGIETFELSEKVEAFPNPVEGQLNLNYPNSWTLKNLQVYNTSGRVVFSATENKSNFPLINTHNFDSGLYSILLEFDEGNAVKRFVKK